MTFLVVEFSNSYPKFQELMFKPYSVGVAKPRTANLPVSVMLSIHRGNPPPTGSIGPSQSIDRRQIAPCEAKGSVAAATSMSSPTNATAEQYSA
jgi:hypothetical protein